MIALLEFFTLTLIQLANLQPVLAGVNTNGCLCRSLTGAEWQRFSKKQMSGCMQRSERAHRPAMHSISFAEANGRRSCALTSRAMWNWLGAVNGNAGDVKQRTALKILGRSSVERQLAFAQERGWKHLDSVQAVGDDYAADLDRSPSPLERRNADARIQD